MRKISNINFWPTHRYLQTKVTCADTNTQEKDEEEEENQQGARDPKSEILGGILGYATTQQ